MDDDERGGRFATAIRRRPRVAFWATLVVGLLLGAGIGAAGNDKNDQVRRLRDRTSTLVDQLDSARSERDDLQARVAKLTAQAEVPDFTGRTPDDVESDETVTELRWNVQTVSQVSSQEPGRVIAQLPKEGTVLEAGHSLRLVVAKKPPPKPPRWVTIKTFQGASSTKTGEFTIPDGVKARLVYSMPEDGNNAITLYSPPDEYVDLLLNEIGPQSGSTRLYDSGTFYLDVTGAYTIQIQLFERPR